MIKLCNVQKRFNFDTINEVYALRDINLEIQDGEFVTVIGTNGSGKSTLLNVIAGTILVDSGSIAVNGEDVTKRKEFERARFIARVFQDPFAGTAQDMTIAENLLLAFLRGKRHYPKIGLNEELLTFFGKRIGELEMQLENRLHTIIGTLSGGQRQAVSLLMAVIREPKVLLLDEHTAALDPKSASQIIKLTKMFIEKGGFTTFMVTHSMQQALDLGNRTIMMHKGAIIDDIPENEKRHLTVNDLLDKFAELRKSEKLTDEMIAQLRREYF